MKNYFKAKNPKHVNITPKTLDIYFRYCLQYGKVNQKTHKREPLAVRSVRDYRSILYSVFNQATIDGLIKINPVASVSVRGKSNKEYQEELLFMTEDEISALLHFIFEKYPHILGIAFLGAYYGLRRSEIPGLKWSAIDFSQKAIILNHTVVRVRTTKADDTTKTQSSMRVLNFFPLLKTA